MSHARIHAATLAAHKAVVKLDRAALDALIAIYADAADRIVERLRALTGSNNLIELTHLATLKRQVDQILTDLEAARNDELKRAIERAAELGALPWDDAAAGLPRPISPAAMRVAQDAVKFVNAFIAKDGLQLSDRLWRMDQGARNTIQTAIGRAIVMGQGATEAARELLLNGSPVTAGIQDKMREASSTRLTAQINAMLKGDGSPLSNALRLMRTEINRAHGEAAMAAAEQHPDFGGHKFLLSPAHPKPDICDLLSTQNLHGLGPGVYPNRESTPWPAHPNTLSFIAVVFKDEVTDEDRAGKETEAEALERLNPAQREGVLATARSFRRDPDVAA